MNGNVLTPQEATWKLQSAITSFVPRMEMEERVRIVKEAIAERADVGAAIAKLTLLHSAAHNGYTEICQLLIDAGADVHARDQFERTPLFMAVMGEHPDTWRLLRRAGADIDARGEADKLTPLEYAIRYGYHPLHHGNHDTCTLLVQDGANLQAKNANGDTPMHEAVSQRPEHRYHHVCRTLLYLGASLSAKNRRGRAPLDAEGMREWVQDEVRAHFHSEEAGHAPIEAQCLSVSGGKKELHPLVRAACLTGLFHEAVAAPLLNSAEPANHRLFDDIFARLPAVWRSRNNASSVLRARVASERGRRLLMSETEQGTAATHARRERSPRGPRGRT